MTARVAKTPLGGGAYEANVAVSAPEVVATAAAELGVSADAAAYYLQLLVVPNPSDARVAMFNDWTGKRVKAAADELIAAEHCVTGKRARAGRECFLPGAWLDLKSPLPSLEAWKLGFLGIDKVEGETLKPPFGQFLWIEPLHVVFARAWDRVAAGQGPRYEEAGEARKAAKKKKPKAGGDT